MCLAAPPIMTQVAMEHKFLPEKSNLSALFHAYPIYKNKQ